MTEDTRSHIVHLLERQQYDEALPILGELLENNPSDRESRTYRLLVVRILVLRWNLSRAAAGQQSFLRPMPRGIIERLVSVVRVAETIKSIQSLGRIYRAVEKALANRRLKRVIFMGAGSAFLFILLAGYMVEGNNVEIRVPSNILTSTDASHLTASSLSTKAYSPNQSRTADNEVRETPLPTDADKPDFSRFTSVPRVLLPTEELHDFTEPRPALSGTDVAKPTLKLDASNAFPERQQPRAALNIETSREPAANANLGNKAPRKILGHYQSGRAIPIRKSPRFAAPAVQDIDRGISLNVLEFVGSWAKVELGAAGITGFVRREFLISVEESQSNITYNSPSARETSDVTVLALESASQ